MMASWDRIYYAVAAQFSMSPVHHYSFPGSKADYKGWVNQQQKQGYSALPLATLPPGFHTVEMLISGKPARLIVDTGAPQFVLDAKQLNALNLTTVPHKTATMIDGAGNEIPLQVLQTPDIKIGLSQFNNDVLVGDLSGLLTMLNDANNAPIIGVIGNQPLTALSAQLDFRAPQVMDTPIAQLSTINTKPQPDIRLRLSMLSGPLQYRYHALSHQRRR